MAFCAFYFRQDSLDSIGSLFLQAAGLLYLYFFNVSVFIVSEKPLSWFRICLLLANFLDFEYQDNFFAKKKLSLLAGNLTDF